MSRNVYVYVFDTMADWEIGYLTTELNSGRYFKKDALPVKVVTVSLDKNVVTTMGGLRIQPDIDLKECDIKENDALILPGGQTWMEAIHQPILNLVKNCIEKNIIVGAICGATMALAQYGFLDSRNHTSNDLGYLKMICPNYAGENHYIQQPSIIDESLITATGLAPLEFTVNVLKALNVILPEALDAWYNLYKTQEQKYFHEIMNLTQ